MASARAAYIATVIALRRSGRASVMESTDSLRSTSTWESIGKSKISEVFYDKSSIKQSSDGERFVADTKVVPFDNKEQTYSRMLFNCSEKTFIVLRLSKQKTGGKQEQVFDKPQPPTPTSKTATLDKLANLYCGKVPQPAVNASEQACAEALEIVARGDRKSSRVVGRKISELQLPPEVHMGLIVRGLPDSPEVSAEDLREPQVIIPRSSTVIESNDHVVFFLPNKRLVRDVEKLFRVSATFF